VTLLARFLPSAVPSADIRPARELCLETRLVALRTAILHGHYRIDCERIAAKLMASIDPHFQPAGPH